MSGGIAYVLDPDGRFPGRCNQEMVRLAALEDEAEARLVRQLIGEHAATTGSRRAWEVVHHWSHFRPLFVRVIPRDFERMVAAIREAQAAGLNGEEAAMAAFEANKRDLARVGGN
jgi:glutamate synthase (ferredoxin)